MHKTPMIKPQLLSERDAATWLGVCPRTLWAIRASGKIPYVRFDRGIRYDVDDLRAYVARNKKVEESNG
jgi:hypothetical protein